MPALPTKLVTLREAAAVLGVPLGTLRKEIERLGLRPDVPGGRGRGRAARYDLTHIQAHFAARKRGRPSGTVPRELTARLAVQISEVLAECAYSIYLRSGPNKQQFAACLAALAAMAIEYTLDELGAPLPDIFYIPDKLAELREIGRRK